MERTDHSDGRDDLESSEISEVLLGLAEVVRSEDAESTSESLDAVVAAASGLDARLAARLVEAAEMIERRTGSPDSAGSPRHVTRCLPLAGE
jgi:hypothetical protein